jgi:succinate dehydrogenase / fumarate reductase membrane anchor subunit
MSWKASGMKSWLLQRLTAVYMAAFLLYFIVALLLFPSHSYDEWQGWMRSAPMALATTLFFLALLGHAWVGMRDVFLDYIKPFALRLVLLNLLALGLIVMALWVVRILLTGGA